MKTTPIALAAILALTAGASFAQPPGPPPGGPRAERPMRPDPAQMAERHAQHLRDVLQLRPDQETALKAYIEASRPPMDRMGRRGDREQMRAATTPERLDRARARMAERMAAFDRRATATKRFYAALSPAQQKAFDAMPQGPGRGGHRGGHGRHGGPGGPGQRG